MFAARPRPFALALSATVLFAGCLGFDDEDDPGEDAPGEGGAGLAYAWGAPVDLKAIGYEPSIAADSTGALFITAHKDLTRPETWPYLASWILVSTDEGKTWHAPAAPNNVYQQYVGDEGDLGVDARDWLYYIDTYLADNHLHVWSDQGKTWKYSLPLQRSTGADDRPWIWAQGNGVVHYLGNNGAAQPGVRYLYSRSTDGGLTWSVGQGLPGAGWAQGCAQIKGEYSFMVQEVGGGGTTDLAVQTSKDQGATWGSPVKAGKRTGSSGDGFPLPISCGPDGNAAFVWGSVSSGNTKGTKIFISRTLDHGATWHEAEITPFKAYIDHMTVASGPDGLIGVSFYATEDLPLADSSRWYLYAGVTGDEKPSMESFAFEKADPQVLYTGRDLHALHDFYETEFTPDGAYNIAYMTNLPATTPNSVDGDRHLWFVRGEPA